jgi:hypothetical protein
VHHHYHPEATQPAAGPPVLAQTAAPGAGYGTSAPEQSPVSPYAAAPYDPLARAQTAQRCDCSHTITAAPAPENHLDDSRFRRGPVTPRELAANNPGDWLE